MNSQPATGATLLSTVQRFKSHDFLQKNANHPFAASFENSAAQLQNLIQATDQLSHSLNLHSSIPLSNPKLISILRQEAAISHTVHLVRSTRLKSQLFLAKISASQTKASDKQSKLFAYARARHMAKISHWIGLLLLTGLYHVSSHGEALWAWKLSKRISNAKAG